MSDTNDWTPEPWGMDRNLVVGLTRHPEFHWTGRNHTIGCFAWQPDNARAIACVNACAGIADPASVLREVREAMAAIAQGAGPYDTDKLKHAENCIEAMKEIARSALAKLPEAPPASSPRA